MAMHTTGAQKPKKVKKQRMPLNSLVAFYLEGPGSYEVDSGTASYCWRFGSLLGGAGELPGDSYVVPFFV